MPLCPECGEEVAKTDTHCMKCGVDLLAAKEKERMIMREQSIAARMGTGPTSVPANAAAAGVVGVGEKSSDETRIRVFDKQEAERLQQERLTAWVTSGMALVIGLVLVLLALNRIKAGGGFGAVWPALNPQALRNGGMFAVPVMDTMMLGMGICAILVAIGQWRLSVSATRAIRDVKNNAKPEIARVSSFTLAGLFLLCLFCPPLGLIIGLVMKFGRNPDLRGLGGTMALVAIGIMVLMGLNLLWKVAENMKPATSPRPTSGG
ncbi:MAG: hypothetical protein HPY44_18605 [Armatimonadetes bacterium]|nr:hypothetical protein [Armatimonadota bacterium]